MPEKNRYSKELNWKSRENISLQSIVRDSKIDLPGPGLIFALVGIFFVFVFFKNIPVNNPSGITYFGMAATAIIALFFLIIGLVLLSSIFTINKKAKFNLSKSVNERDLERIEAGLRGGSVEVGSNVFLIRDYLIFGGQRTIVYIKDIFEVIPEIVDHKTNQGLHWYYSFTVKIKAKDLEETEYTLFDTRISLTKDRIGIEKPYLINISCFLLLELHGTHGTISTDRIAKYYAKGGLWPELFRVFGMDFKPTSS